MDGVTWLEMLIGLLFVVAIPVLAIAAVGYLVYAFVVGRGIGRRGSRPTSPR
jgi:hypothetical protein